MVRAESCRQSVGGAGYTTSDGGGPISRAPLSLTRRRVRLLLSLSRRQHNSINESVHRTVCAKEVSSTDRKTTTNVIRCHLGSPLADSFPPKLLFHFTLRLLLLLPKVGALYHRLSTKSGQKADDIVASEIFGNCSYFSIYFFFKRRNKSPAKANAVRNEAVGQCENGSAIECDGRCTCRRRRMNVPFVILGFWRLLLCRDVERR